MTLTEFGGSPSPMNFLLRLRTYGLTIRMNTLEDGVISWDRDEVQCGSVRLTMSALRSMIRGLVESIRTELRRDLLLLDVDEHGEIVPGSTPISPLDLEALYYNPSELEEDWSFFEDAQNTSAVNDQTQLHGLILRKATLRQRFVETDAEEGFEDRLVRWRSREISKYFYIASSSKRNLLVLVKMSDGVPWRGSELITIQHRNSSTGSGRGAFIRNGMSQLTTGYHKGFGLSAKPKAIHPFMQREVGELWEYYCWLVQPMVGIMQDYQKGQKEFGLWMWKPRGNVEDDDIEMKNGRRRKSFKAFSPLILRRMRRIIEMKRKTRPASAGEVTQAKQGRPKNNKPECGRILE